MRKKLRRGFAIMSAAKQREISSDGWRAVHAQGTGHEFTIKEAREAGRLGGLATQRNRKAKART